MEFTMTNQCNCSIHLDLDDRLPSVRVRDEDPLVRRVLIGPGTAGHVPGVPDHQLKVIVIVNGRGNVLVIPKIEKKDKAIKSTRETTNPIDIFFFSFFLF